MIGVTQEKQRVLIPSKVAPEMLEVLRGYAGLEIVAPGEVSQEKLAERLSGIEKKTKKRPELQIADLCLYPVAQVMGQPDNCAYQAMQKAGLLADCLLLPEELEMAGIKYFCFDGKNKTA